ncbi:hypothetical protein BBW79_14205, partial [Listeria monocytogenes]|nr:hypothetical protein [Listeria monocytogenes]
MKNRKKRLRQLIVAFVLLYTIGLPIKNIVLANELATNEAVVTEKAGQPIEEGIQEEKEISEESTSAVTEKVSSEQQPEEITDSKEEVEVKESNQSVETEKTIKKDVKAISPDKISSIFPDAALAEEIRNKFGKSSVDDIVTQAELNTIRILRVDKKGIVDISGVENLTNLIDLYIAGNQISDITPLLPLTNLENVDLSDNPLSDISLLSNLTSLVVLALEGNQISDISPLSNLTKLVRVYLNNNQISDVSPLANLTNLSHLSLEENQISDVSPLANLTNLSHLYLDENQISDVSPLANLTNLSHLSLEENQISDINLLSNFTNLSALYLSNNQISDINPLSNFTNLSALYLSNNQISDISSLSNFTNLNEVTLFAQSISASKVKWNSPLSVTNAIKDNNGNLIAPSSISNQGAYTDPTITWTGLTNASQTVSYEWNQRVTIGNKSIQFSGSFNLPVEKSVQYYNLFFDIDGQVTTELVEAGELVTRPQDPSKEGYVFTGWYDAETDGNEWDFTTDTMPANDMTLYAQFSKVLIPMPTNAYINFYEDSTLKYAIPYVGLDQWDGINGVWTNGFVTATPPANNPTKTGHTFTGWEDEQGDLFDFSTTQLDLNSQNEFNFYAAFEKKEYTVTFVIDGKMETKKVLFEELIEEPTAPEKEGHTFDGWHTSPQTR